MRDLVLREDRWNLIHIDVQGHEHDICNSMTTIDGTQVWRNPRHD
jgi:hypothetical protein